MNRLCFFEVWCCAFQSASVYDILNYLKLRATVLAEVNIGQSVWNALLSWMQQNLIKQGFEIIGNIYSRISLLREMYLVSPGKYKTNHVRGSSIERNTKLSLQRFSVQLKACGLVWVDTTTFSGSWHNHVFWQKQWKIINLMHFSQTALFIGCTVKLKRSLRAQGSMKFEKNKSLFQFGKGVPFSVFFTFILFIKQYFFWLKTSFSKSK